MYVPGVFAELDNERIATIIDRFPLATLVGVIDGRPVADHLPFVRLEGFGPGKSLVSHVAKANSTWRIADQNDEVLLIFAGADAYISPSLYPSKVETHEVVPTYNYVSVHVRGKLTYSHDEGDKLRCVNHITEVMEAKKIEPWSVSDAPADYIRKMLNGIVALNVEILEIAAKIKASQNRLPKDQAGVLAGLKADPRTFEAANIISERLD
jgi:transcriptional regulator